jgi:hypothetical protein
MSLKTSLCAAALAATVAFAAPTVNAASPASGLAPLKSIGLDQSNIEKTHGWHRRCRKGLNGWHRHVKGVGRIQCTTSKNCYTNMFGFRVCDWF